MGGVSDFVSNTVGSAKAAVSDPAVMFGSGLGMVSGGMIPSALGALGGGKPDLTRYNPAVYNPQASMRPMPQAMTTQQRDSLLQSRMQTGMPQGMAMPQPLAWRQQPQQQVPNWVENGQVQMNRNNYNPYQNYAMRQQPQYQNMGMFGRFNPYMPRR